jgi:hypothetical protein
MGRSVTIGLLAVAAGFALVSTAAADNTDGMVGNTAVCKTANGGVTKVYTGPGGAYTVQLPNGQTMQGTAKDDGKQICYHQSTPATTDAPVCTPSVNRKVGDTWTVQAQGESQDCALMAGHQ